MFKFEDLPRSVKVFKADVNTVAERLQTELSEYICNALTKLPKSGIYLQAGSVVKQNILSPEFTVAQNVEIAIHRSAIEGHIFALKAVKILNGFDEKR